MVICHEAQDIDRCPQAPARNQRLVLGLLGNQPDLKLREAEDEGMRQVKLGANRTVRPITEYDSMIRFK